ncbi:MAG: carboxypeptidase-like regulatory domain-containing protein, partial [Candidatus Woesearchaeota archaeon]
MKTRDKTKDLGKGKNLKNLKKHFDEGGFRATFYALLAAILAILAIIVLIHIKNYIGYMALQTRAGSISELKIDLRLPASIWSGFYGLGLMVPGYTEQQLDVAIGNTIKNKHLVFDCLKYDEENPPEIYASTSPVILWETLSPATTDMVDNYLEVSPDYIMSGTNTFTTTMTIRLGDRNITNIPATHTKKFGAPDSMLFDIGVLRDANNNLVFVTHVTDYVRGFNNELVNYQMLLPVKSDTTPVYYFFRDPYEECPAGPAPAVNTTLYGYVFDNETLEALANVTIRIQGIEALTDENGFYNITALDGTYNLFGSKEGYHNYITTINLTPDNSSTPEREDIKEFNFTMRKIHGLEFGNGTLKGMVTDSGSKQPLINVSIIIAGILVYTNTSGEYEINLTEGNHTLIALKQGYKDFYNFSVPVIRNNVTNYNFSMTLLPPPQEAQIQKTGTTEFTSNAPQVPPQIQEPIEIIDHIVSMRMIDEQLRKDSFIDRLMTIKSYKRTTAQITLSVLGDVADMVLLDKSKLIIEPQGSENLSIRLLANKEPGIYEGVLVMQGDFEDRIPIRIIVYEKERLPIESMLIKVTPLKDVISPGTDLKFRVSLTNLLKEQYYNVTLKYYLINEKTNESIFLGDDYEILQTSLSLIKSYKTNSTIEEGFYRIEVKTEYLNFESYASTIIRIAKPFYMYALFGILPLWQLFLIILVGSILSFAYVRYRVFRRSRLRYGVSVDVRS